MDPAPPQDPQRASPDNEGDLLSPLSLASLDMPASSSSLTFEEPEEVSPRTVLVQDPFWQIAEPKSTQSSSSAVSPKGRVVEKEVDTWAMDRSYHHREDRPAVSGEKTVEGVKGGLAASMKLQQALGQQAAEPFKTPPVMVHDLVERFEAGLAEFRLADDLRQPGLGGQLLQVPPQDMGKGKGKATEAQQEKQDVAMEAPTAPAVLFPSPNIQTETRPGLPPQLPVGLPSNIEGFLDALFTRPPLGASPTVSFSTPILGTLKERKRTRAEIRAEAARAAAQKTASQSPSDDEQQKKPRIPGQTGIRTLPASFTLAWTPAFPGNTPQLSQILCRWHFTMSTLYRRCSEEFLMSVHPLFPYAPTRPVNIPLLSISFWDTAESPHREMRFIGPGDVSSILYAEVDTFYKDEDKTRGGSFKTPLFGKKKAEQVELRNVDMRGRNERGEGRWCFIVVQGLLKKGEGPEAVPPAVTLAWPVSAVTGKEECLYGISHEELGASTLTAPASASTSVPTTSIPTIDAQTPMPPNIYPNIIPTPALHAALRSATSSTLPPPGPQIAGLTLRRATLMFQKAGGIPLVQAYRTDVRGWTEFMEAVGRGEGKVVMNFRAE